MKVREVMVRKVLSVGPDDNAKEALELLMKKKISGLPVIDAKGKLEGMFTEKDVLRCILPSYLEKVGRFIYEENPKSIRKKLLDLSKMKVNQLMRKEVVVTNEDATLCEVARIMLIERARRIPVIDKDTKLVTGIVSRGDILKALTKEAQL